MAADALDGCIAKTPTGMILIPEGEHVFIFRAEGFQLPPKL